MSVSQTYRVIAFTEAQLVAQRAAARRARAVEEIVPALVAELRQRTGTLVRQGAIPHAQQRALEQQLASELDLVALRDVAVTLARTELPAVAPGSALPPDGAPPRRSTALPVQSGAVPLGSVPRLPARSSPIASASVALADLAADRLVLAGELDVLLREADRLGVTATAASDARARLDAAERTLAAAGPAAIAVPVAVRQELAAVRLLVDGLADAVDDAAADATRRQRTLAAVTGALETLGYAVTSVGDGPAPVVTAATDGGRQAEVALTDAGEETACEAVFSHPGHAVDPGHPAATQLCDPAVEDAVGFHRALARTPGLVLGPVVARERPSRASGATSTSATTRARRRAATTPRTRSAS